MKNIQILKRKEKIQSQRRLKLQQPFETRLEKDLGSECWDTSSSDHTQ